jgi:predicted N-formylglutamate amidohydrolase
MSRLNEKNFVLSVEESDSPIILTVPHGGMSQMYSSWLENFFRKRQKPDYSQSTEKIPTGERVALGRDGQIWHVVSDILKNYSTNAVMGLIPRVFIDYNRLIPEVAYVDQRLKVFYDYYHERVSRIIEKIILIHGKAILFDMHGFGKQPLNDRTFDFIIGTNDGETSPNKIDSFVYEQMKDKYQIFCSGQDDLPTESDAYKGDTTNLYYHKKYNIDSLLIEISPKFRSKDVANSKENGIKLSEDFALCFKELEKRLGN